MLQQTRVETVRERFERFLGRFPTIVALAAAPLDDVLHEWEGLGYYSRARNLHRAAQALAAFEAMPTTALAWRELPGVGRYTAAAVASIAFGDRAAVLDGNVKRVLARLYAIAEPIDATATTNRLWDLAEALVPAKRPGDWNQALMELGACICLPKTPRCRDCPVRSCCVAEASGQAGDLPTRAPRKATPHYEVVAGWIERRGRVLVGRRPENGMLGGLWEFPGGKLAKGLQISRSAGPPENWPESPSESPRTRDRRDGTGSPLPPAKEVAGGANGLDVAHTGPSHGERARHGAALAGIVRAETGLRVTVGELLGGLDHAYSHFSIHVDLYRCTPAGRIFAKGRAQHYDALIWQPIRALDQLAMPKTTRRLADFLSS